MDIKNKVLSVIQKEQSRQASVLELLNQEGIAYVVETSFQGKEKIENIIVPLVFGTTYTLLIAHYDVWPGSIGINDNVLSVVALIKLIKNLKETREHKDIVILFADKEERGMLGSKHFLNTYKKHIEDVIVLDIIGHGDTHVYCGSQSSVELENLGIKRITTILPSDNVPFESAGVKTALITAIHQDDLIRLNHHQYQISHQPKCFESFHNGPKDNDIDVINFPLVDGLIDSLTTLIRI